MTDKTAEDIPEADGFSDEMLDILHKHTKMVLAIHDTRGCPNASVMHYALGEKTQKKLYMGTRKDFEKYNMIKQNHCVACVFYSEDDPTRALSIHGIARELDGIEHDLAYRLFKSNNKTRWYIEGSDDIAMFSITPTSARFLDGSSGDLQITDTKIV